MPSIVLWILLIGFVAPAVAILGLVIAYRLSKGNPGRGMGALWLVLVALLGLFGFGIFQGME